MPKKVGFGWTAWTIFAHQASLWMDSIARPSWRAVKLSICQWVTWLLAGHFLRGKDLFPPGGLIMRPGKVKLGGGFIFFFTSIWRRWTHFDEHIFQMGWFNHQLGSFWLLTFWLGLVLFYWHRNRNEDPAVTLFCTIEDLRINFAETPRLYGWSHFKTWDLHVPQYVYTTLLREMISAFCVEWSWNFFLKTSPWLSIPE